MSENKKHSASTPNDTHEEDVDAIMDSIMEEIKKDEPSPVDVKKSTLIEEAPPLDYSYERYDDEPAVILGAGLTGNRGLASTKEKEPLDKSDFKTQQFEPVQSSAKRMKVAEAKSSANSSVYSDYDPYHEESKAPLYIRALPVAIHGILGLLLGVAVVWLFAYKGSEAVSPVASSDFRTSVYLLLGFLILGFVLALVFGLLSRAMSTAKAGRIAVMFGSIGATTIIGVISWTIGMIVADQIAHGLIVL